MASRLAFRSHPEEETLEQYCLGRLDEENIAPIEEHLLICAHCQNRVAELDLFLKSAKRAAKELRQEDRYRQPAIRFQWFGKPIWLAAGTLAAGLLIAIPLMRTRAVPENVELSSLRGEPGAGIGVAKAGHPLNLKIDLKGIASADCCFIEVADSGGKILSRGESAAANEATQFSSPRLNAGRYWVRVKSKAGELLRETGLEVR